MDYRPFDASTRVPYWRGLLQALRGERSVTDPKMLIEAISYERSRGGYSAHREASEVAPEVIDRLDGIIEDLRREKRYDISDRVRAARDVISDPYKHLYGVDRHGR